MGWKSTLFAFLAIFLTALLNGQSCGENFYDSGGIDAPYNDNESEMWTICPDNEGDLVTVDFTFVDLEEGFDILSVFSGSNTDIPLVTELMEPQTITSYSQDGCLTIIFSSDISFSGEGWEASITCNAAPVCGEPGLVNTLPTASGAVISWLQQGAASQWDIEIGLAGFALTGTPTIADITSNPYTWEGGENGESYDFYIRTNCGDDGTSGWVGPFSFMTTPGCGDAFYDNGGLNATYPPNENATWLFCPENPGDVVTINFTLIDIPIFDGLLSVFSGIGNETDTLMIGVQTPGIFSSTSEDGCLTVTFTSNGFFEGEGWEAEIICTSCTPVFSQDISIEDINAFDVQIDWSNFTEGSNYVIEYDTTGFVLGEGNIVMDQDTSIVISGLEENTTYDYYFTSFCPDGQMGNVLGPFTFTTLFNNDLGISSLSSPTGECGLGLNEAILIEITNYGSAPQTLFGINYSVNGEPANVGMPQDGFFTGIVSNDSTEVFEFDLHHDFDDSGEYLIQVWTELEGDSNMQNDTFSIVITSYSTPFFEDFEAGIIPAYITTTFDEAVDNGHNAGSFVLFDNLFFTGDTLKAELPNLGPIADDDVLYFDFRYTDWAEGIIGTTLTENDILTVLISEDCGETYEVAYVLTGDAHEPTAGYTNVQVPLGGYAGSRINIQILGIYGGGGDYWLDIDNINLPTCDKITLDAIVTDALDQNAMDGAITVIPSGGIAPYNYLWDDGSTDGDRTDLSPGMYTVLLTDRFNCTYSATIEVSVLPVGTETLPELIRSLQLMPNPTSGVTLIKASFAEALDTQVELVNLFGQTVWTSEMQENITDLNLSVDLSGFPSAMYLVRIHAGDQIATSKLLKTE